MCVLYILSVNYVKLHLMADACSVDVMIHNLFTTLFIIAIYDITCLFYNYMTGCK